MPARWPSASTLRPVVLWGVLVGLVMSSGLYRDIIPGWDGFALCYGWNQHRCVIDGDTIRYSGLTIRLEDIDTPETHEPKCRSELELGNRATNRLIELLNAGAFEIVHNGGQDEDRYGRKLRVIEREGRSLGDVMIAEGLGRRWDGRRHSWCH
jgi:nuclease-like protein